MVDRVDIQGVLEQMRTLRSNANMPEIKDTSNSQFANTVEQMRKQIQSASESQAAPDAISGDQAATPVGDVPSFGDMFKSAVDTVNDNQAAAKEIATRYEMGDPKVDLPEVMIALQKSSVSFQAMTQVRNKMIEAYKEIINMPL
ncbi:flagellar hook-basal body complex protein FliE [Reinekea blandensis]|uniref:Flagellar hook-basal body complex protein FliE n=1 Tax=Reinekea blandensis MED297 TaxID=314283 RepID=A4BIM9_9GAMM|nr:flagellar hook-basal body complex protein FliE [Reinekea blandensis]EAR07993.1 flagellar hook-basal body complex protein (FliE) [Reinekea sp. MED297] [Reinekea blandensis MED297]